MLSKGRGRGKSWVVYGKQPDMQKECARQDQMNHAIANSVSGGDAVGASEVWVELHPCIQKLRVFSLRRQ